MTDEERTEQQEADYARRRRKARRRKAGVVIDRIFGFLLATVIVFGLTGLGVEYVLIKGPSPALKDTFVMTMLETRRFKWIPNIFMPADEVEGYYAKLRGQMSGQDFDPSIIQIANPNNDELYSGNDGSTMQPEVYELVDEDGDGVIIEEVKGRGFTGRMMVVLDPSRCFIGDGGGGLTIESIAERYGALGGINGGSFHDPNGAGSGGMPEGLTIYDGVVRNNPGGGYPIAGFNKDHILCVGYYSLEDAVNSDIVSCVSFGPPLIINGVPQPGLVSSVNPRSAVGQRADGAVLMLVIDGRQTSGLGATYTDLQNVMLDYGAINACNLDGGSSSVMYYNGSVINMPSSASGGSRWLPNAFLFK